MKQMVSDLLSYSRLTSKPIEMAPSDINALCMEAIQNLKNLTDRTKAKVNVKINGSICVDRTQIILLFQNIIGNAIKYQRAGESPDIQIWSESDERVFKVHIKDNGIGIDPKYFGKIFDIFKRLHSSAEYDGNGIGLAFCRKIVERHGGHIWVDSKLGHGSTFS